MKKFSTLRTILILLLCINPVLANFSEDSTVTLTDSLLVAHTPPSPAVIFPSLLAGIPGMLTFGVPVAKMLYNEDEPSYAAAGFVVASISYPFYIGHGMTKIRRFREKERLMKKYAGYSIIDKTSLNAENVPSFYGHFGLHHSRFRHFKSGTNIGFSAGISYQYPLFKYLSVTTGFAFHRHNIKLNNKIYRPEEAGISGYFTLMNVAYQGVDFTFPIGLQTTFYRNKNFNLFAAFEYSVILPLPGGDVENIENFEPADYDDYDFSYSELWLPFFNEELVYSIGLNIEDYQLKFSWSHETASVHRSPGHRVFIEDKINIFGLQFGFRID